MEKTKTPVSKGAKSSERGSPTAHAQTTQKGIARSVICGQRGNRAST